jgi:hypothetical protein
VNHEFLLSDLLYRCRFQKKNEQSVLLLGSMNGVIVEIMKTIYLDLQAYIGNPKLYDDHRVIFVIQQTQIKNGIG